MILNIICIACVLFSLIILYLFFVKIRNRDSTIARGKNLDKIGFCFNFQRKFFETDRAFRKRITNWIKSPPGRKGDPV